MRIDGQLLDWEQIFGGCRCGVVMIQNYKPNHETARNIFQEDRSAILAAAERNEFRLAGKMTAKQVIFMHAARRAADQKRLVRH